MNINLEKAKEEFIKYTERFNLENERIKGKQKHSIRVMNISQEIATKLGMNQEEIELATVIGLLHDIARFKQYTQFETFSDTNSFDHGDYAIKILEQDIRKYVETSKYDEIIKKAIKNHNKFEIDNNLTEKEKLFTNIVRDADKIDILYEATYIFWAGEEKNIFKSKISDKIYSQFSEKKLIKRQKNVKIENVDSIISIIAFIFDINFKESFEIIKDKNYINLILDRFKYETTETQEKIKNIKEISNNYIEEKINK